MSTQMIISIIIFILVIVCIITERVHRTSAAIVGAVLLIIAGVMSFDECIEAVDFNTIGVLVGMMLFVATVRKSGFFEFIAIKAAKIAKGDPWKIMVYLIVITAVLSAFLDNVTTVLLVGPMTIIICESLGIYPVPFLVTQILASNIGGTATLIGDPPNIMLGSAAHLSFADFIINNGVIIAITMVLVIFLFRFIYKKNLKVSDSDKMRIMNMNEKEMIKDGVLFKKSIVMLILVALAFILHDALGIEPSVIALTAGGIIMVIGKQDVEDIIAGVEWTTILFFVGLFIVVGGMEHTGVIKLLATLLLNATGSHMVIMMIIILWASALLSSVLDNIPFVATLIPLILDLEASGLDVTPLWWAISLGACLGGNGTLIGASANVVLSSISTRKGYPITFSSFFKISFPIMLFTVAISTVYLLIKFH